MTQRQMEQLRELILAAIDASPTQGLTAKQLREKLDGQVPGRITTLLGVMRFSGELKRETDFDARHKPFVWRRSAR